MAAEYCVELFADDASFGPGTKLAEIWDARNVGWSRYDRLPGKGFLTLSQQSPALPLVEALTTHVAITRLTPSSTTQVFAGEVIDYVSASDEVVIDLFDYTTLLGISRSGWQTLYQTKKIGTEIVSPEWTLARTVDDSPLGFVATGTIEDPLGTDDVTPIKTSASFGLLAQMRLQLFYDLSEMGRANTDNHVSFEITRTSPYTFHFRKDKGVDSGIGLVLNGNVLAYAYAPGWLRYRNDIATVGMQTTGGTSLIVKTDETATNAKARRQDVFTIRTLLGIAGAATEADQQQAVAARELKRRVQAQPALWVGLQPGILAPFAGWDICDKATLQVVNGIDSITGLWRILGARCLFDEYGEDLSILVGPVVT